MKLKNTQRIKLIKDIAVRLNDDDWISIDLVLKQFKLPIANQWSSDKKSYVVEMVGDATDADLIELAEHFGITVPDSKTSIAPAPPTPYWREGQLKVFISHLTTEREQAAQLQTALSRLGMSGFVAHNDINPTLEWQIEIETALSTCELLVALVHPNFVNSKWCDQEIGYALGRGVPVFSVKCGADPHGFVSRFQAFNGNGKTPTEIANLLFNAAIEHKVLNAKMADVLVDLFANSGSFAVAKARIEYLERLKVWDASYAARLIRAVKTNSQISGSWGVTDRVKDLIEKWKT